MRECDKRRPPIAPSPSQAYKPANLLMSNLLVPHAFPLIQVSHVHTFNPIQYGGGHYGPPTVFP